MKDQFQSTETLRIRLTPFVSKSSGDYITTGTDVCTLTIKKPDGTLHTGAPVTATWDSVVKLWFYDITTASFAAGEWRIFATSNDATTLSKWVIFYWGDYVDDITSGKTSAISANSKLGIPAGVSVSADIAALSSQASAIAIDVTAAKAASLSAAAAATASAADVSVMKKVLTGRWKVSGTQLVLYELDGTTEFKRFDLKDDQGNPSGTRIFERIPQ